MLLLLCGAVSGCFSYIPTELETTPPGEGVRLIVTRQGATEVSSVMDVAPDVPIVDGKLVGTEGSDVLLSVSVAQRNTGFISHELNQTVRVPRGEILSVQRRELDGLRTGLAAVAAAGLVTAVIVFIVDPFGSRDPLGPPDPPELRGGLGWFSVPIGP